MNNVQYSLVTLFPYFDLIFCMKKAQRPRQAQSWVVQQQVPFKSLK